MSTLASLVLVLLAVGRAGAQAPQVPPQILIDGYEPRAGAFLRAGSAARVHWEGPVPEVRLRAVYRPGSRVETREDLGAAVEGDREWTPQAPGLVKLEAYRPGPDGKEEVIAARIVSVEFGEGFPIGVVIMIGAGLILFGGAAFSIRALLAPPESRA